MKKYLIIMLISLFLPFCGAFASEVSGTLNLGLSQGATVNGVAVVSPTASVSAGTFQSAQSVSLTANGANSIRYTVDGSSPTCPATGSLYSSALSINSSQTLKAVACYDVDNSVTSGVSSYTYTFACPTVENAASYNAYPTCGPASCFSGYSLSGGTCVRQSSGGGGGGSAITYCSSVTFGDWQSTCFNGVQYRNTLSQTPSGCSLTDAQKADQKRTCGTVTTPPVTPPITPTTPPTSPGNVVLQNIASESEIVGSNDKGALLNHLGNKASNSQEQAGLNRYRNILGLDKNISETEKLTINDFIVYGTRSSQRLGAGERAAVINSYFEAYNRLPNTEEEWSDVLKIANGRWPLERSVKAENQAKIEFKKVYAREANLKNNIDQNAIMVMAYGLLPLQRNLNNETVAIKTFRWVYGHDPVNALAWNVVRAIAYSGAKR